MESDLAVGKHVGGDGWSLPPHPRRTWQSGSTRSSSSCCARGRGGVNGRPRGARCVMAWGYSRLTTRTFSRSFAAAAAAAAVWRPRPSLAQLPSATATDWRSTLPSHGRASNLRPPTNNTIQPSLFNAPVEICLVDSVRLRITVVTSESRCMKRLGENSKHALWNRKQAAVSESHPVSRRNEKIWGLGTRQSRDAYAVSASHVAGSTLWPFTWKRGRSYNCHECAPLLWRAWRRRRKCSRRRPLGSAASWSMAAIGRITGQHALSRLPLWPPSDSGGSCCFSRLGHLFRRHPSLSRRAIFRNLR